MSERQKAIPVMLKWAASHFYVSCFVKGGFGSAVSAYLWTMEGGGEAVLRYWGGYTAFCLPSSPPPMQVGKGGGPHCPPFLFLGKSKPV